MTYSKIAVNATLREEKSFMAIEVIQPGIELTKKIRLENIFSENDLVSTEFYILMDRNGKDFYPFPIEELEEWQKDGSFERGDTLYKMNRLRTY